MSGIIKPLGATQVANTAVAANTFGNSTLIRVTHYDNPNTATNIYCYYANNTLRWSAMVIGGESVIFEKGATDKVNSSSIDLSVQIVPVAYKN
jgi:hypothetical protein